MVTLLKCHWASFPSEANLSLTVLLAEGKGIEKQASDFPPGTQFKSWGGETCEWIQSSQIKRPKKNQLRSMTAPHNVCQKVAKMCERWDQTLCQDEFRKEYSRTKARAILVCTWKDILSWDIIFCVGTSEHSGKKDFWGLKRKTESRELAHELRARCLGGAQQMLVGWMTQELSKC